MGLSVLLITFEGITLKKTKINLKIEKTLNMLQYNNMSGISKLCKSFRVVL